MRWLAMAMRYYCRIDAPAGHAAKLRQSITDLAGIALAHADAPAAGRKDHIKAAVTAHLLADARAHGCTLTDAQMQDLLAVDLELNAQGLEVWLQRREKRGEARAG
jgi:hypothetical protein